MWAVTLANTARWQQNEQVRGWLSQCRLNSAAATMRGVKPDDEAKFERLKELAMKASAAGSKLAALLAQVA
jgi:hypothetical protein